MICPRRFATRLADRFSARLGAAALAILIAAPVAGQDVPDRPSGPLRDALAQFPIDAVGGVLADNIPFSFVDIDALLAAASARSVEAGFAVATGDVTYLAPALRLTTGPAQLADVLSSPEDTAAAVGFDWMELGPVLEIGEPPANMLLFGGPGPADREVVAAALAARDFEREEVGSTPVWHRFEDLSVNLMDREPADPFWGNIGGSARIAMTDDYLIASRAWPPIRAVVLGTGSGLDEMMPVAQLLDGLDAVLPAGARVIQAMALNPAVVAGSDVASLLSGDLSAEAMRALADRLRAQDPQVPLFAGMLVADAVSPDGRDHALVLLAYLDPALAETAAAALPTALAETPSTMVGEPLLDVILGDWADATVGATAHPVPGGAVAVLSIAGPPVAGDNNRWFRNRGFWVLVQATMQRDLGFLIGLQAQ